MSWRGSRNTKKQEKVLVNPFDLKEKDEILEKIYITHFPGVETYDVGPLYSVASNIIKQAIAFSEHLMETAPPTDPPTEDDGSPPSTSFARFPGLKGIAYRMICTPLDKQNAAAHETTMLILQELKGHSWDAKAVIAMAAFALEYGKFWDFARNPEDTLEKSLAVLNGVQNIKKNKQQLSQYNDLVKKVMEMMKQITEWKKLTNAEYDVKDVPALSDTLQLLPVVVYWAIITFVACTSTIDSMGEEGYKYELSKFDSRLNSIHNEFKEQMDKCKEQIGAMKDYSQLKAVFNDTQAGKDIVKVLKALLIPRDTEDSKRIVHNLHTGQKIAVDEFKDKYVLLFISDLDNIKEEIQHLKSIYEGLKQEPKEVKGYKKEDFTILWVPIVGDWNDMQKNKLEKILKDDHIEWYVVEEFNFPTGKKLIREVFNYKNNPIIPLISPEGKVENPDAKQIIFDWGIEGFPFRTFDQKQLTQQWNWFWDQMIKLSPRIKELKEKDNYIFIYGSTNNEWFQKFTEAAEKFQKTLKQKDITIELYPLGKEGSKIVPRFWIGIDNLLASKKQNKGGEDQVMDTTIADIENLLSLKQDPDGWVLLSKGSRLKVLGQGEAMYLTVKEFEMWKTNLDQEGVSLDVAFKKYYDSKVKDECAYSKYDNYPTDILAHIPCPNKKCGREMEVASVNYKCCHGRETNGVSYK